MIGFMAPKKDRKKTKSTIQLRKKKKKKSHQAHILRIMKDLEDIGGEFKDSLKFPNPKCMDKMEWTLRPSDGIWKKYPIVFDITIPREYPIKPPKCLVNPVNQKLWHPNFNLKGKPCLNILREDWTPVLNLNAVMVGLHFLFLEPNPNDPLNEEAADHYEKDYDDFIKKAKRYMKKNYN